MTDPAVRDLEARVASLEQRLSDADGADDTGLLPGRKTGGSDAQVLKKVSSRLQESGLYLTGGQISSIELEDLGEHVGRFHTRELCREAGLGRALTRGRRGRPPGRWEDAQVTARGPTWTDERRDIAALVDAAANGNSSSPEFRTCSFVGRPFTEGALFPRHLVSRPSCPFAALS